MIQTRYVGAALRRRKLAAAAILAGFLAGGLLATKLVPISYEAQAQLRVGATQSNAALDANPGLFVRYYAQLATTRQVLDRVAARRGLKIDRALINRVHAEAATWTDNIVVVYAQAPTGDEAAALANAVAQAVLDEIAASEQARRDDSRAFLTAELARLDASSKSEYLATYEQLQDRLLASSRVVDSVVIQERAVAPATPSQPDPSRYLLVALMAGVSAALFGALLLERLDDRIFDTGRLARAAGARVVAGLEGGRVAEPASLPVLAALARHLETLLPEGEARSSLLVVAASRADRAAPVAESLAAVLKQSHKDLQLFHTEDGAGGGSRPGVTRMRLRTPRELTGLIEIVAGPALTLVSTPSPLAAPAALTAARQTRAAVLVATAGSTHASDVARSAAELRKAGVQPVGAVLLGKSR